VPVAELVDRCLRPATEVSDRDGIFASSPTASDGRSGHGLHELSAEDLEVSVLAGGGASDLDGSRANRYRQRPVAFQSRLQVCVRIAAHLNPET